MFEIQKVFSRLNVCREKRRCEVDQKCICVLQEQRLQGIYVRCKDNGI